MTRFPDVTTLMSWVTLIGIGGILFGTIGLGLSGVILPAFGLAGPGDGLLSLSPLTDLFARPGVGRAALLSLGTGLVATVFSILLTLGTLILLVGKRSLPRWEAPASVLLAAPHAALAAALAFMLAPSGLLGRMVAVMTGSDVPSDYAVPGDPFGLTLVLGLTIKEFPFLLLIAVLGLRSLPVETLLAQARTMGYRRARAVLFVLWPQLYPLLRLPLFIALGYAATTVDQALILGPVAPPTLSVLLLQLFYDPDLASRIPLAAGTLVLAGLVGAAFLLWRIIERSGDRLLLLLMERGRREGRSELGLGIVGVAGLAVTVLGLASLFSLGLSAFALDWRFPALIPKGLGVDLFIDEARTLSRASMLTLAIAVAAGILSPMIAFVSLEMTRTRQRLRQAWTVALFLPLLVPEILLIFGLNVAWVRLRLDGTFLAVLWAHLLYTVPYAWLILSGPHRDLDPRLRATSRTLGRGPLRTSVGVVLPVLTAPMVMAGAVAALISAALYLPTLIAGAGRVPTLLTETVALSASGDRRIVGGMAILLLIIPLVTLRLAQIVPRWLFRNRVLMGGTA